MIDMNMFGQMPGGQSPRELAMAAAQSHLQSQKAGASINPVANPLGAMAQNPLIDPVAENFSPTARAAGAGMFGSDNQKYASLIQGGTSAALI